MNKRTDAPLVEDDAHNPKKCERISKIYHKAFDDFAGPSQFRHSVNYDTYHRAGLIGLWNAAIALRSETAPPLCGAHAASWFTERNHLKGGMDADCVVCAHEPAAAVPPSKAPSDRELVEKLWNYEEHCRERGMMDMAGAFSDAALALSAMGASSLQEYPNLAAIYQGTIAGEFRDWVRVRGELRHYVDRFGAPTDGSSVTKEKA